MKKAIITVSKNNPYYRSVNCYKSCTKEERFACQHFDCMRRNEPSVGGLGLCPLLKNGFEVINEAD